MSSLVFINHSGRKTLSCHSRPFGIGFLSGQLEMAFVVMPRMRARLATLPAFWIASALVMAAIMHHQTSDALP